MKRMRLGRMLRGWTIRDTAQRAGVAYSDLWAWETGKKPIYPAAAKRLAKVLGYFPEDLADEFSEAVARKTLQDVKRGRKLQKLMRMEANVFAAEIGNVDLASDFLSRWAGWSLPTKAEWATFLKDRRAR